MMKTYELIFSVPKSVYFNFKVLPFSKAIKFPFLVSYKVKLGHLKKCVFVNGTGICSIKIGFGGSKGISEKQSFIEFGPQCKKVVFNGKTAIAAGCNIIVNTGELIFGDGFSANKNMYISSDEKIVFGKNCLLGSNINMRDSDGHKILYKSKKDKAKNEIIIGNHVWICSYVDILKGATVGNDSVIAYRSLLPGGVYPDNSLIVGGPAKVIQTEINWEK